MDHVPMTRPEELLALHEMSNGHSTGWVELDDGRILMMARANKFRISEDGGITWSEPFTARDEDGQEVIGGTPSLVRLSSGALGLTNGIRISDPKLRRSEAGMSFQQSDDDGRTWTRPVRINRRLGANSMDTLVKTSSGRLIQPMYGWCGQGTYRAENAPMVGGYLQNGRYMSTDAHYVDPHFSYCFVAYSDDDGRNWECSEGELFIKQTYTDSYEYANEPSVAEISPSKLMMVARNRMGRLFQARSEDDGTTWGRLQPMTLAASTAPAQIRRIPANGHLLMVWNQENDEDIRRGLVRLRLSSAISRNGGDVWEFHQNIESILPGAIVEPGPIQPTVPEGVFHDRGMPAVARDGRYIVPLPKDMGRWSYPSVLVLKDRVLVAHTYSRYDDPERFPGGHSRIKVLPLSWFYGGADPLAEEIKSNSVLDKFCRAAQP